MFRQAVSAGCDWKLGLPVHNCLFARFVNSPGFVYVERP